MTFYFYDLETSGIDPRYHRIMQFAGQRTNEDLEPIGEPQNWLVKLTDDVLPDPEAILITGITPQQTILEGFSEAEFCRKLQAEVFQPDTVMLGFNTIRFDDEFLRYTLYRSFYDPYEREWSDDRSRWDILDLVRMTRALRPEGIEWPFSEDGKPTNRLELLAKANNLTHEAAHDALSDVVATIEMTKLLKQKQPKLYGHLLKLKDKREAAKLLNLDDPKPLVHTSGRLGSAHLHTTVVIPIAPHPENNNAILVYDLRFDPKNFADLDADELAVRAFTPRKQLLELEKERLPVKAVHLNKSPALAPLGVLDEKSQERINLSLDQVESHLQSLRKTKGFGARIHAAWQHDGERTFSDDVDGRLYDGFLNDADKKKVLDTRMRNENQLADWHPEFHDERLKELLLRYKARNYPNSLSEQEASLWEQYRAKRLTSGESAMTFQRYFNKLAELANDVTLREQKQFLIEELQLYGESIAPFENEALL